MNKEIFPRKGEIYLVNFNRKREKEIFKIRPALVISSNYQNEHDRQILMAPISAEEDLTTEEIELLAVFAVPISSTLTNGLERESRILLHRLRAVKKSPARLLRHLGAINPRLRKQVKETLQIVLELD